MFDRQSMVRKSLLHVQNGLHALQVVNGNDINTDSVQRRSRSRKPHGNRRNTIVGIGQKEIKTITENRFVNFDDFHRARVINLLKFYFYFRACLIINSIFRLPHLASFHFTDYQPLKIPQIAFCVLFILSSKSYFFYFLLAH
jgi:hypothetical protein